MDWIRLNKYTETRDEYRIERQEPPKWSRKYASERSYEHAALCADLPLRSKADQGRLFRILWDLFQHGGNMRKFNSTLPELCNLCNAPDSASHWIQDCTGFNANLMRQDRDLSLQRLLDTYDAGTLTLRFLKYLIGLSKSQEDGHHIILGQVSRKHCELLMDYLDIVKISELQRLELQEAAVKLGTIWIEFVLKLYVHKRSDGKQNVKDAYLKRLQDSKDQLRAKKSLLAAKRRSKLAEKEKTVKVKIKTIYQRLEKTSYVPVEPVVKESRRYQAHFEVLRAEESRGHPSQEPRLVLGAPTAVDRTCTG